MGMGRPARLWSCVKLNMRHLDDSNAMLLYPGGLFRLSFVGLYPFACLCSSVHRPLAIESPRAPPICLYNQPRSFFFRNIVPSTL